MLKEFYVIYINENIKENMNPEKTDSIRRKYCTVKLLDQYGDPELEYDPFVHSQMIVKEFSESINVKKSKKADEIYYVILNYNSSPITIKIKIIKVES